MKTHLKLINLNVNCIKSNYSYVNQPIDVGKREVGGGRDLVRDGFGWVNRIWWIWAESGGEEDLEDDLVGGRVGGKNGGERGEGGTCGGHTGGLPR